jgi:type I restriction enzyme S subunit
MEVRPGYKQTGVGVIPDEWDVKTIDQVAFVTSGKRLPLGSSLVDVPTPHPYVRVTDMRPGTVDISEIMYVPESVFPAIKRYRIYQADIFISVAGSLGIVGKIPAELDGANLTENADRITDITCSQDYLLYVLLSPLIQKSIDLIRTVGAQPKLALTRIRKFAVPLPPTEIEQRAIATALSDVDALLGGLDRLIAKKRDLKQAAMQQLLTGQTRLSDFHGEWEVKRLGEICEIAMGRTPARLTQAFWGHGYTWLSIADLQAKVVSESKEEVTELAASTMTIIPKGTLLMSFKLSIGRLCFAGCDLFTNEAICSFNKLQANADFLYYALGRTDFSLYGKQAVKGYTLNKESLKVVEVRLPSLPEQTAIAAVLSDMDAELAALEARRDKTRDLKQAMMQELLTGRTRLV